MHNDYERRGPSSGSSYPSRGRDSHSGQRGDRADRGERSDRRGVPLSELDPNLTGISHKVIGCARDVHMSLGPGYEPAVYREALKQEMTAQGITFKTNHPFTVHYKGQPVGHATADLFIADRFVVTVAAVSGEIGSGERAQLRSVLRSGDLELGLIINFAGRLLKDGLVRVLNPDKIAYLKNQHGEPVEAVVDEAFDPDAAGR
jgi:GxxExxY protein